MVNRQQYRDSQLAVQTYLQQQYNLVQNVENGRTVSFKCTAGSATEATKVEVAVGLGSAARGQSDCILLGRLVVLKNGTTFNSYAVVGQDVMPDAGSLSDTEAIKAAFPGVVTEDIGLSEQKKIVPWQGVVSVNQPDGDEESALKSVALFIARSPISGSIHTYRIDIANDNDVERTDFKSISNSDKPVVMCIESGLPLVGERLGIKIDKSAASQSGVAAIAGKDEGCL